MKTAVIIPTYNEKENIQDLIPGIFNLGLDFLEIIVIDDNSPDGTAEIVSGFMKENKKVHLIKRKGKMGLGSAYLDGFRYALENGFEYFFEMDADFSHDFSMIPVFLEHIKNSDLVIGSRYIPEGKIENWNFTRRFFSKAGNIYAKAVLNIPISDLTTGYKCYRRSVVEKLKDDNISSIGYVFQIETTFKALKNGFTAKEIPIVFSERKIGKSKFNFGIIWESFWKILKIKFLSKK